MKEIQAYVATSVFSFKILPQMQSNREWLQGSVCMYLFALSLFLLFWEHQGWFPLWQIIHTKQSEWPLPRVQWFLRYVSRFSR